jgi:hypothetical protein
MKECSECGQWSAGSAKKCKHCGVSFDKYPPNTVVVDTRDEDEVADLRRQIRNHYNEKLVMYVFTGIGMLVGWVSAQLFGWEPLTLVGAGAGLIAGIVISFKLDG